VGMLVSILSDVPVSGNAAVAAAINPLRRQWSGWTTRKSFKGQQ
jgi:hypothetical protein